MSQRRLGERQARAEGRGRRARRARAVLHGGDVLAPSLVRDSARGGGGRAAASLSGLARPGRPPSRRRSRPRAAGTSVPERAHCARAVRATMELMRSGRTYVRTLGGPADGRAAARAPTCGRCAETACWSRETEQDAATKVACPAARRAAMAREAGSAGSRANNSRWLLRSPDASRAARSWAGEREFSPWRSSSSKAVRRCPAR